MRLHGLPPSPLMLVCALTAGVLVVATSRADDLPVLPLTSGAPASSTAPTGPAATSSTPAPTTQAPAAHPGASPAGDDPVVARVNGDEIHRSDVESAQRALPAQAQKLPFDQVYPVLLERVVSGELLSQAGRKEHLGDDPEVQRRLDRYRDRLIQQAYIDRLITAGVTEDKVKAEYQKFVKEQPQREEVHAQHILVPTEEEAKQVIAELDKGGDFAALAKKYSKDAGGNAGGDLGYFTRDEMVPEFAAAAFALPVGQYTKAPVKTEFGWHVIKVEDRRKAPPPTYEQAHEQIAEQLANEIVDQKIETLRSGAKIQTFGPDGKPMPPATEAPAPGTPAK